MKILTITCHDVYNVGASLQAFALMEYLADCGHEVEIIDYKPDYLSKHYSLTAVYNPKYDKPGIKQVYLLVKLSGRVKALLSARKRNFDMFRKKYLQLTPKKYHSNDELKARCPEADVYIAGSDQIWNPLFQNGKRPSVFLDFVPSDKCCISYAGFAVDTITPEDGRRISLWLQKMNAVAVRESSAIKILESIGVHGIHVCDPVFLPKVSVWENMVQDEKERKYVFYYDFDENNKMRKMVKMISQRYNLKIVSAFKWSEADIIINDMGPLEFLGAIKNARVVFSNSFHATAFALLFHKEFFVLNRTEKINARMKDLVSIFELEDRMIEEISDLDKVGPINWDKIDRIIRQERASAQEYLCQWVGEER